MTYKIKKIIILSIAILLFISINYFINSRNNKNIAKESDIGNNSLTYENPKEMSNITDANPIEYKYKKLEKSYNMTQIDRETMAKIVKKIDIREDFDFYIYTKPPEDEYDNTYYAAVKINNIFYEIGEIGYKGLNLENSIEVSRSSYKNTFIIQGGLGANYIVTYYIAIEDKEPMILFDAYSVSEVDLDGDGEIEFVDSFSGMTSIYRIKNKEVYYISVNDLFKKFKKPVNRIFFEREKNAFLIELNSTDSNKLYDYERYIYTPNGFKEIEKPTFE